jgi:hypothetical protein
LVPPGKLIPKRDSILSMTVLVVVVVVVTGTPGTAPAAVPVAAELIPK